jgi:hypothetical protein
MFYNSINSAFLKTNQILSTNILVNNLTIKNDFINNKSQYVETIATNIENIEIFPKNNNLTINGNLDMCQNSIINVAKIYNNILEPFNTLVINGNLDMCNNSINQVNEINNGIANSKISFDTNSIIINPINNIVKFENNIDFSGNNRIIKNVSSIKHNNDIQIGNNLVINGILDMSNNDIINVNQLTTINAETIKVEQVDISNNNFFPVFVNSDGENKTLNGNNSLTYNPFTETLTVNDISLNSDVDLLKTPSVFNVNNNVIEPKILFGNDVTNSDGTKTITYEPGFFTHNPVVLVKGLTENGALSNIIDQTIDGFTCEIKNLQGDIISNVNFDWLAIGN